MSTGTDAGRVSMFLAIALTALLAIIGLSYDAAGRVRTLHTAQLVAAEAARAAGQAVEPSEVAASGQHRLDVQAAVAAADAYLDAAAASGEVAVDDARTRVSVTVHELHQPVFLSLFGAGAREVTGTATASLVSG